MNEELKEDFDHCQCSDCDCGEDCGCDEDCDCEEDDK